MALKPKDAPDLSRFDWEDPFRLDQQLTEDFVGWQVVRRRVDDPSKRLLRGLHLPGARIETCAQHQQPGIRRLRLERGADQFLGPRQAHLSGVPAEAAKGVEALLPDRGECLR